MDFRNTRYYNILGVTQDASIESIERAKDRLKFGNEDDRVPFDQWGEIDEAYEVLHDPERRRQYDAFLASNNVYVDNARTYEEFLANKERRNASVSNNTFEEQVQEQSINEESNLTPSTEEQETELENEQPVEEPIEKNEPVVEEEQPKEEKTDEEIPLSNFYTGNSSQEGTEGENSSTEPEEDETELEDEQPENENTPQESEEHEQNESEQNSVRDFSRYTEDIDLAPSKKFEKLKAFGEYTLGALAGLPGILTVYLLRKRRRKGYKLYKDSNIKKIGASSEEISEIEQYNKKLDSEIDKLLASPNNSYKLAAYKAKYENRVQLLTAMLDIRRSKRVKNRFGLLKNKLEIASIVNQLKTAQSKLKKIQEKIEEYSKNGENRLSKQNREIIENNITLEQDRENSNTKAFKKLEIKQNKLIKRRDKTATRTKAKLQRRSKFYDKIISAKNFVTTIPSVFKSYDSIDEEAASYEVEEPVRTR